MSQGWRTGNENIPKELHHRPLHLVKHMRTITEKAAQTEPSMITNIDNNRYEVQSSTVSNLKYTVQINDGNNMPSCSCYQFKKTHLLCKHFAAVFTHHNISWNTLPYEYTSNVLFIVDTDCVNTTTNFVIESKVQECNNINYCENEEVEAEEANGGDVRSAKVAAKQLREELAKIYTQSYIVDDEELLKETTIKLQSITQQLKAVCPSSEGLVLEADPAVIKKPKRKPLKVMKDLPLRKKKVGKKKGFM